MVKNWLTKDHLSSNAFKPLSQCLSLSLSYTHTRARTHPCILIPVNDGHLDGEERAGCFAYFVFLVSRACCVALPGGAMGLSEVCDCGIS